MKTTKLPALFFGHGSPMNAVEANDFTAALKAYGAALPRPKAILCVSAHWMTEGTWITGMESPMTIHDFYGFPQELFEIQYPAPGNPALARKIAADIPDPKINLDLELWGIDHGAWAILRHLFPAADVPVLQLSVSLSQPAEYHFLLGQRLRQLREQGILIVGSGNIVHNLRQIKWEKSAAPYDWAVTFDEWVKNCLIAGRYRELVDSYAATAEGKLSVPSPDHYYPLLYVLGAANEGERLVFLYEGIQNASISMRSFSLG